jgi:hypothetical protein
VYEAGASLGRWDRGALERERTDAARGDGTAVDPHPPQQP